MTDLSKDVVRKQLSLQIKNDIDSFTQAYFKRSTPPTRLGVGSLANDCLLEMWLSFRWCYASDVDGRTQRLFDRGTLEEPRFVKWLKGIDCKVWEDDFDNNKLIIHTGNDYTIIKASELGEISMSSADVSKDKFHLHRAKADGLYIPQYRVSFVEDHLAGFLDCVVVLPERYGYSKPLVGEFKTNSTGRGFNALCEKGIRSEKKKHAVQVDVYGSKMGFEYGLYLNTNKNDDDIHCEVIPVDKAKAECAIERGRKVITSQTPLPKLSLNCTFHKCNYCDAFDICHGDAKPLVNCRSCKHAKPEEKAAWVCTLKNKNLLRKDIKVACDKYDCIFAK